MPAGLIVIQKDGPKALRHGVHKVTRPPNDFPTAEADKGASKVAASKNTLINRTVMLIHKVYCK